MLIYIKRKNGYYDFVKPRTLDQLLNQHGVEQFKRRSGWAVIGRDPIRLNDDSPYFGIDRRINTIYQGQI